MAIGVKKTGKKSARTQTVEDIAAEHDVATETIRRWVRDGCPADRPGKGKPTKMNSAEVEGWKRENGVTGKEGRPIEGDSPDLEAAKLRKENALASKYELQVARERGQLVPIEDVKRWLSERVGTAKNHLIGLAAKLVPSLAGRDAAEQQAIIEEGIRESLQDLSSGELQTT